MEIDVLALLESLAETGTPPTHGCTLFGVGYDDAFERLKRTYLERRFSNGGSAEKFVVGPFGSGKTHFLRQFLEIARDMDCVTAEVPLTRSVDITKSLDVYAEVVREVRPPRRVERGIEALVQACLEKVRSQIPGDQHGETAERLVRAWIDGLTAQAFRLPAFATVVRTAFVSYLGQDDAMFDAACRWLRGEVSDRQLARRLEVSPIPASEHNVFATRALHSLFQLIRCARFRGTVVGFDEAEQSMNVEKRKLDRILSMLQSDINAISTLRDGSALVIYAITDNLYGSMQEFPALQQRVVDPGDGMGFFDGNTLAPVIDLRMRQNAVSDLEAIGQRLVDILYDRYGSDLLIPYHTVLAGVTELAREVAQSNPTIGNRREFIRRVSASLVTLYDDPDRWEPAPAAAATEESEV